MPKPNPETLAASILDRMEAFRQDSPINNQRALSAILREAYGEMLPDIHGTLILRGETFAIENVPALIQKLIQESERAERIELAAAVANAELSKANARLKHLADIAETDPASDCIQILIEGADADFLRALDASNARAQAANEASDLAIVAIQSCTIGACVERLSPLGLASLADKIEKKGYARAAELIRNEATRRETQTR